MVISSRGRMGAIKNKASCVAISTAITSYQADYGTFPVPPSALQKNGIVFLGVEPGQPPTELLPGTVDFFQALCGNVNASSGALVKTGLNPRNLQYLTLPKDRVDARGVLTQMFLYPNKPAYFSIAIDVSNSGKLKGLPNLSKGDFSDTVNDSVAVWCCNDQPFDKPNMRWATTW